MPGMSGSNWCPWVKQQRPDLPVFMISAYGDQDTIATALARGADKFLTKPVHFPQSLSLNGHGTVARSRYHPSSIPL